MKKLLSLSALLLVGCATVKDNDENERPHWLTNPQRAFPLEFYFTGIGSGPTRRDAENAALASLAQTFKAEVKAVETSSTVAHETFGGADPSFVREDDYRRTVNVSTALALKNVTYPRSWKSPSGRVHVIAAINRNETGRLYRDAVARRNTRIQRLVQRQVAEPVKQYAALREAARLATKNAADLDLLRVLNPGLAEKVEPPYSVDELADDLGDAAGAVPFAIHLKAPPEVVDVVRALVVREGFRVADDGVCRIEGHVELAAAQSGRADRVDVNYVCEVRVVDPDGQVVATVADTGRESSIDQPRANRAAVRQIEALLERELVPRLNQWLDSLAGTNS